MDTPESILCLVQSTNHVIFDHRQSWFYYCQACRRSLLAMELCVLLAADKDMILLNKWLEGRNSVCV